MGSFFLPNWSPPDDPARPLPAEGRPWPSDDDDEVDSDPHVCVLNLHFEQNFPNKQKVCVFCLKPVHN